MNALNSSSAVRIRLINPNTSAPMTEKIWQAGVRASGPDVMISTVCPIEGPVSMESHVEEVMAARATIDAVRDAEAGVATSAYFVLGDEPPESSVPDAYVVACFGDPGVDAARELTTAPVLGIAEAAMHTAVTVGRHFSVVIPLQRTIGIVETLVHRLGFERSCVGLRAADVSVLELEEAAPEAVAAIIDQARQAVSTDGAEVIVLGSAGMADLSSVVSEAVGVPVVDGVAASVGMAAALVRMGLLTSKIGEYAPSKMVSADLRSRGRSFDFLPGPT